MKKIERVVVVPRWSGNAGSDWYPWIRGQLADEVSVEVAELPRPDAPRIDHCVAALREVLSDELASTLLVGHSVGCQALLRSLASLAAEGKGAGGPAHLLCVAGWWSVDEPWATIRPWIDEPIDLEALRGITGGRVSVLLSDNDPFTADWRANQALWRERLGADVRVIPGGRHFNLAQEPAVLERVRELLSAHRAPPISR